MALHKDFPRNPHAILDPEVRWFPADESLREASMDKLIPPLVANIRKEVKKFRDSNYEGASDTSKSLLNWWFKETHPTHYGNNPTTEFKYYFAQREAIETIVYLYDAFGAKDKYDLMRFDSSGAVSANMFDEDWRRYVIKIATGCGKTKVMSLALAWSFFHKTYEMKSELARNFLIITPNIIVLDRLRKDFEGLKVFFQDPVLPSNGYDGRNWRDDFQLRVHLQDEVQITRSTGNIFLTNIHRVYSGEDIPASADDENTMNYFLGKPPTGGTIDSKVDLGMIVRDINELMVLNDEAHHIHDKKLAWFQSIQDIHDRLVQKGSALSLQVDVTATPKHDNGAIFVQTIADYPLVEAIRQNIVKHPVVPNNSSREQLQEQKSSKFTEKYAHYINLGVAEWRNVYKEHKKAGKTAILFVMTDDTRNCDEVKEYLERYHSDLRDAVLVIHTKNNGEISEASSGKNPEELKRLREKANTIDNSNEYKAIVSVLMLKEGWDVRNVTTIVGLRAYSSQSKILPEQTLGRGLRKMYPEDEESKEEVSVVGTDAFMDFIDSIQIEGVDLEHRDMGKSARQKNPLLIEVDYENKRKNINALDIEIPVTTPRIYRKYKNLSELDITKIINQKVSYKQLQAEGEQKFTFVYMVTDDVSHEITLDINGPTDYRHVISYFAHTIMKMMRLVSCYDVLYGKIKSFIAAELFEEAVELEDQNTLRNLSEQSVTKTLIDGFVNAINDLTVHDRGVTKIRDSISLQKTRPFVVKNQEYTTPEKSVFNRIIVDKGLERRFVNFLEGCPEVFSYAKNYFSINFKLDYVAADGNISNYYPDFIVKLNDKRVFIIETKGLVDVNVKPKMKRLKQWCEDTNHLQSETLFDFIYVDEKSFREFRPKNFTQLLEGFREYKK